MTRVLVVGAGVAGLLTVQALLETGTDPLLAHRWWRP